MLAIEVGAIVVFGSLITIGIIAWILIWRLGKNHVDIEGEEINE